MLKPNQLLDAMSYIDDEQIAEAEALLQEKEETSMKKSIRRLGRTLLIAAALSCLFIITAFAASRASMSHRDVEPEEKFHVRFETEGLPIEGDWRTNFCLEFEGPSECEAVHFKPGWLPYDYWPEVYAAFQDGDGWYTRITGESIPSSLLPEGMTNSQPYMIEVYYVCQFVPDGAMILFSEPEVGPVTEEQWGDVQVTKFTTTRDNGEYGVDVNNYLILFHPEQGWIIPIRGAESMETLEHIAWELQVEPTGETVRSEDFENPYVFIDVAVG